MFSNYKNFILASILAVGTVANAQQDSIGIKAGERLNGMQRNFNLKTGKERRFGDICRLTLVKKVESSFLFAVDVGMTSPNSLSGSDLFMKVKYISEDTLKGTGSEQRYLGEGTDVIIKKFNHKVVIKLDENNSPESFILTSENGIDQVHCEYLSEAGV